MLPNVTHHLVFGWKNSLILKARAHIEEIGVNWRIKWLLKKQGMRL
jgi:hypothetical protein